MVFDGVGKLHVNCVLLCASVDVGELETDGEAVDSSD